MGFAEEPRRTIWPSADHQMTDRAINPNHQRTTPAARTGNVRDHSRNASREVRRFIESCVANGSLKAGDKIPNERDLATQFATGRNTIRKVLISLEAEGLVERHVGRGTFLTGTQPDRTGSLTDDRRTSYPLTPANEPVTPEFISRAGPLDLMELRIAVEPYIAQQCALRAGSDEISRMQNAIDRSRVASSLWEFENCDDDLHREIASASRNPLFIAIADMITSVRTAGEWGVLKERTLSEEQKGIHTEEHVAIVSAIRQRDATAAKREMEKHLQSVLSGMLQARPASK
ncbi:FadR/GntR family transcriptional regulator [Bradyrhizobium jicamae]|uniref:FadR/GntR family transcriptional regulator n=1 Tax=Bradyrhizobium jicamae TaxID=280332 RepID=UPI001BA8B467|nr:FCD domain-containing protein [Bradyrhizobium jicamae]MBR0934126.1 FadR family transcriptional regulator [Bradyrhizobium jicamae]